MYPIGHNFCIFELKHLLELGLFELQSFWSTTLSMTPYRLTVFHTIAQHNSNACAVLCRSEYIINQINTAPVNAISSQTGWLIMRLFNNNYHFNISPTRKACLCANTRTHAQRHPRMFGWYAPPYAQSSFFVFRVRVAVVVAAV